jgi:acetolactate synthase I/II/III large subunit
MSDERTGAQIMCEALIRGGVDVLFGIPGGAIMPFYHALWEYRDQLRHVLCRHEQGAGHAAEGFARATGRVGVCVATSGPGATNLVTAIADASMDSTPLLAITGQVSSALLGTDAFQEVDITGVTLPITKHNYLVKNIDELPYVVAEALHLAQTGRPGAVLVDVTKDCQQSRTVPDWNIRLQHPGYRAVPRAAVEALDRAARLLANAERPLVMAGNGVIQGGATRELLAFAESTNIPVITTLHGLGAFPAEHPLSLGMPGMHGWVHVNRAIQRCDVLLAVGMRFDDRVTGKVSTFAPHARVIHADIDAAELGKLVRADVAMHANAREVLARLTSMLGNTCDRPPRRRDRWHAELRALRAEYQPRQQYRARPAGPKLMPHDVYDAVNRALHAPALSGAHRVVTDVGQHQMWAAQLIDWRRPRSHITSGGAGTMGFAVPAALGVAIACPDETVIAICGDGGFQMTNQELATISQEQLRNIKVVVINNGCLGMVRQWQQLFHERRYSNTPLSGPDFALLARSYGWEAWTIERCEDVCAALDAALAHDGPALIDFRVEREANVFPIVPQGKAINEMMLHEEARC